MECLPHKTPSATPLKIWATPSCRAGPWDGPGGRQVEVNGKLSEVLRNSKFLIFETLS